MRPHPPSSNAGAWGAGGGSRAEPAAAGPARRNLRVGSRRGFGPDWSGFGPDQIGNPRANLGRPSIQCGCHTFQCDTLNAPRAPVVRVRRHSNCGFLRPASWVPARPARRRAKRISGDLPPRKAYSLHCRAVFVPGARFKSAATLFRSKTNIRSYGRFWRQFAKGRDGRNGPNRQNGRSGRNGPLGTDATPLTRGGSNFDWL